MTPHLPALNSYVRAVEIYGLSPYTDYIGRVGVLQTDDYEGLIGRYVVKFPGFVDPVICDEIEPATRADYDADWPDDPAPEAPEPEKSTCIICEAVSVDGSDCDCPSVGFKTASAVLEAGNDPSLRFFREQLTIAECDIAQAERNLSNAKWRENILLDLIAVRMDQLKKGNL
jgi:hypothetical protein